MTMAFSPDENYDILSRDPNASPDVLNRRKQYLQQAIARASSTPNPDPQTIANINSFQAELSDLGNRIGKIDTNKTLDLFTQNTPAYNPSQDTANINEMFNTQQGQQARALDEMFAKDRGNAIEEAAALGNLRQPTFTSSTLNNIDAMKARAMQELFASLGIGKNQALLGAGAEGRNYNLNRAGQMAGIQQGGEQFAQSLGFQKDKFGTQSTLAKRQQDLDELFRRDSLSEQIRKRDDEKPGLMDKLSKGTSLANQMYDAGNNISGNKYGQDLLKQNGGSMAALFG